LQLTLPDLPWHAERDRSATIAGALGFTAGVLGKIATDIILLSQNEVAEVAEGMAEGKGVSSAMPQKRNPVDAVEAIAASRLAIGIVPVILAAMSQEHERGAGGWQTEWQAIPDLFRHTGRASRHVHAALSGLEVFPERMRENIDVAGGVLMAESLVVALAASIARPEAQRLVGDLTASALKTGASLLDVARVDERVTSVLSSSAIEKALDPAAYLGSSDALIDRALQSWRDYETQAAR
jgi:3-carboxy-cis,cis-muconate cycloisomerase